MSSREQVYRWSVSPEGKRVYLYTSWGDENDWDYQDQRREIFVPLDMMLKIAEEMTKRPVSISENGWAEGAGGNWVVDEHTQEFVRYEPDED